jgi:hypothetical protein
MAYVYPIPADYDHETHEGFVYSDGFIYFRGDGQTPVEGDWRQGVISNELVLQEYESGVWTTALHNFTTINIPNYTLQQGDHLIHVIHTAAAAIMLATNQVVKGRTVTIKDATGDAAINNITLTTQGSELIDGQATYVINTNYEAVTLYSDGVNWFII